MDLSWTHGVTCRLRGGHRCSCTPQMRIRLLELQKEANAHDPSTLSLIEHEIATLQKLAVIYTHAPHLLEASPR